MEQQETPITSDPTSIPEEGVRPVLALAMEDVGNLDAVLRGYYLSQIKSLEKRKDRKLARQLLEDHLVLPKSRQRTSKDAAYIRETLEMDDALLENLQNSRLIRRIHKSGNNPIYEISHDTLVEPILAEKRDREAIARFIKRTWKYFVVFLLLWFLCGMLFEKTLDVLPSFAQRANRVDLSAPKHVINLGANSSTFVLPLEPLTIDQDLQAGDSLFIKLPLDPIQITRADRGELGSEASDTISIQLTAPIEVPLAAQETPTSFQNFSNIVVPLAYQGGDSEEQDAQPLYARLSGNLKLTNDVLTARGVNEYDQAIRRLEMDLGDTLIRAGKTAKTVPVSFSLQLTDLFDNEIDKNYIRTAVGDRLVTMNYLVQVNPGAAAPPSVRVEYPAVQGIEVQYADGTSKFIPGNAATDQTHTVASGETLFSIAKKYGLVDGDGNTSTLALKQLNGISGNAISVGQVLKIPKQ
ncbi:MAG: LysM peptidoglycan-binding domain-containing protein [Saprospiraceae bacterium]|nr:LysM peptidoglycan-binding domain-containing protein [Saprospiraceae bacterium]